MRYTNPPPPVNRNIWSLKSAVQLMALISLLTASVLVRSQSLTDYKLILKQDKERLIAQYLEQNTNADIKTFGDHIDTVINGATDKFWPIGYTYERLEDYSNARLFYQLAAENESPSGISDYAHYLIEGIGGDIDIVNGSQYLLMLSRYINEDLALLTLQGFRKIDRFYTFHLDTVELYWLEYYAFNEVNALSYQGFENAYDQYGVIGNEYEHHIGSQEEDYNYGKDRKEDKTLLAARDYYGKSKRTKDIVRINGIISGESLASAELSPELNNSCQNIFDHQQDIAHLHRSVQTSIFTQPDKSVKLVE